MFHCWIFIGSPSVFVRENSSEHGIFLVVQSLTHSLVQSYKMDNGDVNTRGGRSDGYYFIVFWESVVFPCETEIL